MARALYLKSIETKLKFIEKHFNKITNTHTIIFCYLILKAYQLIFATINGEDSQIIIIGKAVSFIVPLILAILIYKKIKIALWLMVVTLLVGGVSSIWTGAFIIPIKQYYLKPLALFLGVYFTYGGIKLFIYKEKLLSLQLTENTTKMV